MLPNENYYSCLNKPLPLDTLHKAIQSSEARSKASPRSATFPAFTLLAYAALVKSGAMDLLEKTFTIPFNARRIAFLAIHFAQGYTSLEGIASLSYLNKVFSEAKFLTEEAVCDLFTSILNREAQTAFLKRWCALKAHQAASAFICDVTSLNLRARAILAREYASAHGNDPRTYRPLNYALLLNADSGLPLYYVSYAGELTAIDNLQDVKKLAHKLGFSSLTLSLESTALEENQSGDDGKSLVKLLKTLYSRKLDFILPLPRPFKAPFENIDPLLIKFIKTPISIDNTVIDPPSDHISQLNRCQTQSLDYVLQDGSSTNLASEFHSSLHLYRHENNSALQHSLFTRTLGYCRAHVNSTGTLPEVPSCATAAECFYDAPPKETADNLLRIGNWSCDLSRVDDLMLTMGCFAMLASPTEALDAQKVLNLHRFKEDSSEFFANLYNDHFRIIQQIPTESYRDAKCFLLFLAAIIRHLIKENLCSEPKNNRQSLTELINSLSLHEIELYADGTLKPVKDDFYFNVNDLRKLVDDEIARKLIVD